MGNGKLTFGGAPSKAERNRAVVGLADGEEGTRKSASKCGKFEASTRKTRRAVAAFTVVAVSVALAIVFSALDRLSFLLAVTAMDAVHCSGAVSLTFLPFKPSMHPSTLHLQFNLIPSINRIKPQTTLVLFRQDDEIRCPLPGRWPGLCPDILRVQPRQG